jgi:tripartite-type tricarboxylate transporter receptor subunit TctC
MFAPAGTPDAIVNKMHAAVTKALQEPTVQDRLKQMGVVITATSPAETDRFVKNEVEKWGKVVRDNKITVGP